MTSSSVALGGALLLAGVSAPASAQTVPSTVTTDAEEDLENLTEAVDAAATVQAQGEVALDEDGELLEPVADREVVAPQAEKKLEPAPIMVWNKAQALELLKAVNDSAMSGLDPKDYNPAALQKAITAGEGKALNEIASKTFTKLAINLRDGVTPMKSRIDWYIEDPDSDKISAQWLMSRALTHNQIVGALAAIEPAHPDYRALKVELANTPKSDKAKIEKLRVNLDRWRWLPRSMGDNYIFVNVPEFTTELWEDGKVLAVHKVVVGKTGTPTPQLMSEAKGAIFNPKWYLPQSIVAEGIGNTIRTNPAAAAAKGYTWSVSANGRLNVVQGPGPGNSLGLVKMDMPNPHAIYLHDTPAKSRFEPNVRAFSHGCIRTDKALLFMGMLAVRYGNTTKDKLQQIMLSGETTPVKFKEPIPVFINYFTATVDGNGKVVMLNDIYGRDAAVSKAIGSL